MASGIFALTYLNPTEVILGEVIRKVTRFSKVKRGGGVCSEGVLQDSKGIRGILKQRTINIKFKLGLHHTF